MLSLKKNLFVTASLCVVLLTSNFTFIFSTSSLPASADVEMLMGDDLIFVDSAGQAKVSAPEIISPEGFSTVIQPKASMASSEVSKAFRNMRSRKFKDAPIFSSVYDDQIAANSLSAVLSESLRRPQVIVSLNQLQAKGNKRISVAKGRLQYYQPLMEKIFAEEGVPTELLSIGFVESTFNPSAVSPAGARGIWQFIPSTGRHFGLQSDEDFEDPVKSTKAAAKYLKRLHQRFGDWLLAIAAYNAGDTRVQQAINMSNGNRDFWEVSRYLPNETRNYVPRVVAASTLFTRSNNSVALLE